MKMKKILNEWRRYNLAESLDKGLLQLGQPDGLMRVFVDSLGTEYVSTTGTHRDRFEQILGQDALDFLQQRMHETRITSADFEEKRGIRNQLENERITPEEEDYLQQAMRAADRDILEKERIYNSYRDAFNGTSLYLVRFSREFEEEMGASDFELIEDLADLKSDYFIEKIKENPEFVSFIEKNFYKFFDTMVEMVGVNPTSLWLGQKTSTGKAQPSNAPQIVAAGAPQDWFFANAGRDGGFHEFAQAVETKLKADPEINLRPPQPDTEPEPEPPAPPQSERMADMMSRFGAFFGDK